MLTFGVVGTGAWGTKVIKAIRALGYDVRVCNRHGEFEDQSVCRDYKKLIPEVDIVWVATHPSTNCEIAAYAIEHNKPTVVEKPVAFTSQQVAGLVRASKAKQVPLIVDYIHCFNDRVTAITTAAIMSNVRGMEAVLRNTGPERDYSALWDYGSHAIAFLLSWSRPNITHLEVQTGGRGCFYGLLRMGDAEAAFSVSNTWPNRDIRFGVNIDGFGTGSGWRLYDEKGDRHPLQGLISRIVSLHLRNEYWSNGDLAVEVTDVLERLHKLLPQ